MSNNQLNYRSSRIRGPRSLTMQMETPPMPSVNGYSLTNVLKELAFLTYEMKTIRQQKAYTLPMLHLQKIEKKMGNRKINLF